jgi:glycosyltransferase involved in cell wall biosynthesis
MSEIPRLRELILVMPVYNEEGCITPVVDSWRETLAGLAADYELLVLDDGSTDRTAEALAAYKDDPRVTVVRKPNSGHGPTILAGYRRAVEMGEWVFQCDSDGEMRAEDFHRLWRIREGYDALFGIRTGGRAGLDRRFISMISRAVSRTLFGSRVTDVNVPYRLMRGETLRAAIARIPDDAFAPNIIISGALSAAGARIANVPVPRHPRAAGKGSLVKWTLWRGAARSFVETVRFRLRRMRSAASEQGGSNDSREN